FYRVAEAEDHGVRHRARGLRARELGAERSRAARAAADYRRIVQVRRDARMNMSRPEAHDGYGTGRFDAFISGGGPARLARQRAEGRCLIDAVRQVLPLDAKDDLFGGNPAAF